jgi:hypothetical protein
MMSRLNNGDVLVAGGYDQVERTDSEIYDAAVSVFVRVGDMAGARSNGTATLLTTGMVLVTGGSEGGPSAELYNPASRLFTPENDMSAIRNRHTATLLENGRVLIAGGQWRGIDILKAELYDPENRRFLPTGEMTIVRTSHTATRLLDGRVLFTGGVKNILDQHHGGVVEVKHLATSELYDPASGTFLPTGDMVEGRFNHTATLLTNGEVLIVGGATVRGNSDVAELYDPETGRFRETGRLNIPRQFHVAVSLEV